jgi:AhpD family alkylhydroperoxidase
MRRIVEREPAGSSIRSPARGDSATDGSKECEMSRVDLVDNSQAPLLARALYAKGTPGPITASLAHVPELLVATAPFLSAIYGDSAVSLRLKEIVILRTSARLHCRYCVQTHTAAARDAGLSRSEVLSLRDEAATPDSFADPRERALLRWTDELAAGTGPVDDDVAADLQARFSAPEIVELTLVAGATMMLNRYCTALDLPTAAGTLERLQAEGLT